MVEYSGYIPNQVMDWSSITNKIATDLQKTIEERQAKREALDKEASDIVSKVNEYQGSKAPTFNQFVMDGANKARNYIYDQNKLLKKGLITPSEYSRNISSLSDSWKRVADNAKSFDADYVEQAKRIDSGIASSQEIFQNKIKYSIADLKGKSITISDNGQMFISSDKGEIWDVQTMNAGLNQKIDKVDLYGDVNKYVKMLGEGAKIDPATGKYAVSETLISDWKNKTKPKIIESISSNPQKAAGILTDYSGLGYSFTTNPKESGGKNILLQTDENGIYTPKLTEEQQKQANKIISDVIDSQVSYKAEKPENFSKSDRIALENVKHQNRMEEKGVGKNVDKLNNRYNVVTSLSVDPQRSKYTGEITNAPHPGNSDLRLHKVTWIPKKRVWNYQFLDMKEPDLKERFKNRKSQDFFPNSNEHKAFLNDLINSKQGENKIGWSEVLDLQNKKSAPKAVNLNATAIKKGK